MSSATEIQLTVAGLGIKIVCPSPLLASRLRARYAPFLRRKANTQARPYTIHVQIPDQLAQTHAQNKEPVFEGGRLYFTYPGAAGWIDPESGAAHVTLASKQQMEEIDYFVRAALAMRIFRAGGLLFHAAGVIRNGRAYLFFGPSGSGKTTVSRVSPNDMVLNDDLVALMPAEGGWVVHGTPFWSPSQVLPGPNSVLPHSAPLRAVLRLVQDTRVYLDEMSRGQAVAEMIANAPIVSADPSRSLELIARCQQICDYAPVYRLHFLPDDSFWDVVEDIGRRGKF